MCPFCMKQAARTECYRKCTDSKLVCPVSECDKKHAKELHNFLTKDPTLVNMLECKEHEIEGNVKMVMGKDDMLEE